MGLQGGDCSAGVKRVSKIVGVASATQVVRKERGDKVTPRKSREGNSLVQGEESRANLGQSPV